MIGLIFWYEANFSDSCSWSLKDTVCLWAIFMSFYIYRASELFDALPLPLLKFLGRGLWSGTNEWIKVRSPAPPHYWVTNAVLGRVTTAPVANIFSQLAYGNLYSFFCLFFFFITAVVNLDNSVVDLETLQALYENVSNRRTFKCEYIIHTQYRIYLGSLF